MDWTKKKAEFEQGIATAQAEIQAGQQHVARWTEQLIGARANLALVLEQLGETTPTTAPANRAQRRAVAKVSRTQQGNGAARVQ